MKRFSLLVVAVLVFAFFVSPLFADVQREASVREQIAKLGFPNDAAVSLAKMVEQGKYTSTTLVPSGTKVEASVRDANLCTSGCTFRWPDKFPAQKAEFYSFGNFTLYRIKNSHGDIFYREKLPAVETAKAAPTKEVPKMEKTALVEKLSVAAAPVTVPKEEKKAEMQKTPSAPVQKTEGNGIEKVYEATVLPLDLKDFENQPMTAVMVPISRSPWIGDGLGTYTVTERDGKDVQEFLTRKVWRAYVGSEIYPAIITKFGTYLFIVVQGKSKLDVLGQDVAIVSGSGKFALTLSGNMTEFDLKKFEKKEEYRNSFYEKNPSKVAREMIVDISPNTENGQRFMADLKKLFPGEYYIEGKKVSASTDIETLKSLAGESNNSGYLRRVVQKGGLPNISTGAIAFPPAELARMLFVWTVAAFDNSLTGNFLEAKVSGLQAAQALSPYLAQCQEEMDYMQKIILQGGNS